MLNYYQLSVLKKKIHIVHHQINSFEFVHAHCDKICVKNKRSEHDTAKQKLYQKVCEEALTDTVWASNWIRQEVNKFSQII